MLPPNKKVGYLLEHGWPTYLKFKMARTDNPNKGNIFALFSKFSLMFM